MEYGMVQIKADLNMNSKKYPGGEYVPNAKAKWVNYGSGDTKSTAEAVAAAMEKQGFKTRILKDGDPRIRGANPVERFPEQIFLGTKSG